MLESALPHLVKGYAEHLAISSAASLGLTLLRRSCEVLLGDPSMALTLLSGIGEVASAEPAHELWDLGRMVARDPMLETTFDVGLDGLPGYPQTFLAQLAELIPEGLKDIDLNEASHSEIARAIEERDERGESEAEERIIVERFAAPGLLSDDG